MRKFLLILTIFILSIFIKPVKALEEAADTLKKNIVTSGDGLYVDNTVDGRYIYRGGNPNNYIKLGDDLYRIISLEKDGTIKVIKQDNIKYIAWDAENARYSTNNEDFCTSKNGCKAWGSNTTTLDINGNKVTQMPWEVNGTLKNLPDKEASLNTYLNNEFYNGLSTDVRNLIVEKTWNIGSTAHNQTNLSESIKEESSYKWKGKVALMSVTDYVKSSTNSDCTSVKDYQYIYAGGKESCYINSSEHNYLYSSSEPWTISPDAYSDADSVFHVISGGNLSSYYTSDGYSVHPVFYLSSETKLGGKGTKEIPYTLITTDTNIDKKENSQNYNLSKLANVITKKVITSGDGLYADKNHDGRYIYKGGNPNNFIKFNNELWRIISVEKDDSVKIIRANPLDKPKTLSGDDVTFNDINSIDYGTYCRTMESYWGTGACNAWGKSDKIYNGDGTAEKKGSMNMEGTVTNDSLISDYLNHDYYKNFSNQSKSQITSKDHYFGPVDVVYEILRGHTSIYKAYASAETISQENKQVWNGKIALPSVSDVLLAGIDENNCGTLYDVNSNYYSVLNGEKKERICYFDDDQSSRNEECYNNCADTNWLIPSKKYKFTDYNYVLINPVYNSPNIWVIAYQGFDTLKVGDLYTATYNNTFTFRPVTYLKSDLEVSEGDGSENNPYIIRCSDCNVSDSNQVVDVPSTSMFVSVFIIGGFILIVAICIVIYLKVFKKKDIKK